MIGVGIDIPQLAVRRGLLVSAAALMLYGENNGLAIDFTAVSAKVKDTGTPANNFDGDPNDLLTYSGASAKMIYGSDGVLKWAAHNLLPRSQEFNNAAWVKSALDVTVDAAVAPDGQTTADKLIPTTVSTASHLLQQQSTSPAGNHTFSVYLKAAGYDWARVSIYDGANRSAYFDVANGVVGITDAGVTAVIEAVGSGWYKCSVTFNSAADPYGQVFVTNADGGGTFAGDGTSGIYAWQAQLNRGATALARIVTTSAAKYALPVDYNPVTGAAKGLLAEEQRTNLLLHSQAFDNAYYTKAGSSVTANAASAPDGQTTADKLVEDTASSVHILYRGFSASAQAYSFSVYLQAAERSWAMLRLDDGATLRKTWFNLSTGVVGTTGAGITATIIDIGGGIYRCTVTYTATAATHYCVVGTSTGDGIDSYTGDGTSGIYIWQAQLEAGSFATSPIPTTTATVTRAADDVTLATSKFPASTTAGTLSATFIPMTLFAGAGVYSLNDGANTNRVDARAFNGSPAGIISSGGTNVASFDLSTQAPYVVGAESRANTAYAANDFALSADGGTVLTDKAGAAPASLTGLQFGALDGGTTNMITGHIKRLVYVPRRVSNADLPTWQETA